MNAQRHSFVLVCMLASLLAPAGPCRTSAEEPAADELPATRPSVQKPADRSWVAHMQEVHRKFKGKPGTLAFFGDSITVTMAFWCPLTSKKLQNVSPEMAKDLALVKGYLAKECWREWKGPKFGNNGRMKIDWAHANVDTWLNTMNPEAALIMFGTNDLKKRGNLLNYEKNYREVIRKCLDNGTIVILHTIPPFHRRADISGQYADVVRKLAKEMNLPVSDYYAEVMRRRPEDWSGKMEKFKLPEPPQPQTRPKRRRRGSNADVDTLIGRDGVHPSYPAKYKLDFSEESLNCSGYNLRSYLALTIYADVVRSALKLEK